MGWLSEAKKGWEQGNEEAERNRKKKEGKAELNRHKILDNLIKKRKLKNERQELHKKQVAAKLEQQRIRGIREHQIAQLKLASLNRQAALARAKSALTQAQLRKAKLDAALWTARYNKIAKVAAPFVGGGIKLIKGTGNALYGTHKTLKKQQTRSMNASKAKSRKRDRKR
jgi:multidrug resistance efflux pump